jgi:hypothetical protein
VIDRSFPLLPEKDLKQLEISLNFFHLEELRDIALKLSLPTKSKKGPIKMMSPPDYFSKNSLELTFTSQLLV